MGDLAVTGATNAIQTFRSAHLALSHMSVAQLLFLHGAETCSNGNTPGLTCCRLPAQRLASRSTLPDVLHISLHRSAGRSPGQDATHTLFSLDRHSSSSVLLLELPQRSPLLKEESHARLGISTFCRSLLTTLLSRSIQTQGNKKGFHW